MKIGQTNYQMRAVQNKDFMYLFNPWHNGKPVYSTSSMGGAGFKTILKVGKTDPVWAARAEYLLTRVPEEFFDLRTDPHCMNNLIDKAKQQDRIKQFKAMLAGHLKDSEDPMAEVFEVYQKTKSVPQMVETYAAMWDKHGIPGRVARNPVNMSRWTDSPQEKPARTTPTDEERKEKRAARRAAAKKDNEQ